MRSHSFYAWLTWSLLVASLLGALGFTVQPLAAQTSISRGTAHDYTGDGRADFGVYRPSTGEWFIRDSATGTVERFVISSTPDDQPIPADYDGDGKTDIAIFRWSTREWWIRNSSNGVISVEQFNDGYVAPSPSNIYPIVPVPADYDSDGKADLATYNVSNGEWRMRLSRNGGILSKTWSLSPNSGCGVTLVPGDYDGDRYADLALWNYHNGEWKAFSMGNGQITGGLFGAPNSDEYVIPADYDGDGKTDRATFTEYWNIWRIARSAGGFQQVVWGDEYMDEQAVPADYDGDGKTDLALWSRFDREWQMLPSNGGPALRVQLGQANDTPLPQRGYPYGCIN